jgi:hypothetical protein
MKKMPNGKPVTVEWLIRNGQVMTGEHFREHYDEVRKVRTPALHRYSSGRQARKKA